MHIGRLILFTGGPQTVQILMGKGGVCCILVHDNKNDSVGIPT